MYSIRLMRMECLFRVHELLVKTCEKHQIEIEKLIEVEKRSWQK